MRRPVASAKNKSSLMLSVSDAEADFVSVLSEKEVGFLTLSPSVSERTCGHMHKHQQYVHVCV